jgi:5-methylcytosine-specific restriction endonuclease McrA
MPSRIPTYKRPSVGTLKPKRGADAAEWRKRVIATNRWKEYAERYLGRHGACVMHWARGELVQATQVHHRRGRDLGYAYVEHELAPLCASCHSRATLAEQRGQTVEIPRAEPVEVEENNGHYS